MTARVPVDVQQVTHTSHGIEITGTIPAEAVQVIGTIVHDLSVKEQRPVTTLNVPDSPKMIRETLCVAQSAIGKSRVSHANRPRHLDIIQRLIDECDRHRPLGPDGKHDDRHTDTCGCEDNDDDKNRGLYAKYRVERADGKPIGPAFVLERNDPLARPALLAYAKAARDAGYGPLADDLERMAEPDIPVGTTGTAQRRDAKTRQRAIKTKHGWRLLSRDGDWKAYQHDDVTDFEPDILWSDVRNALLAKLQTIQLEVVPSKDYAEGYKDMNLRARNEILHFDLGSSR